MRTLVLIGAYGRTYSSRQDAARDWARGKDFKIEGGPYTSIRDIEELKSYGVAIEIKIANGEPLSVYAGKRDALAGII